ncbi:MAG: hypothetical protein O6926_08010 [candidate division NC10 bacterium]|nr:hypothetical protein [candidate division NC10 bacterium]
MTYARDHRRAVRRVKEKQKKRLNLRRWEQKRLDHDKQLNGGEKKGGAA